MWAALLFFVLLVATSIAFFVVVRRQQTLIRCAVKARERIELEETRVFDFLHGLGTALSDTARPTDLHVLIVEGALRILNSQGGALYLSDAAKRQLQPMFVSRNFPPFFEIPENIRKEAGKGA